MSPRRRQEVPGKGEPDPGREDLRSDERHAKGLGLLRAMTMSRKLLSWMQG